MKFIDDASGKEHFFASPFVATAGHKFSRVELDAYDILALSRARDGQLQQWMDMLTTRVAPGPAKDAYRRLTP